MTRSSAAWPGAPRQGARLLMAAEPGLRTTETKI